MHIIGLIGTESSTLYAISAIMWVATVVITTLYIQQRLSLTVAISAFGIIAQLMGSARIVYMAMRQPTGFEDTIIFNQIISLALIIYLVMAVVRHVPTIVATMSIATIIFVYIYTDGSINKQIMVIFIIVDMFTCVLGEMIRRGIRNMQRENADYNSTLNQLLATFRMTKSELLAYIQLGRSKRSDKEIADFFNRLDERQRPIL